MKFTEFVEKFFPDVKPNPHAEKMVEYLKSQVDSGKERKFILNAGRRIDLGFHASVIVVDDMK